MEPGAFRQRYRNVINCLTYSGISILQNVTDASAPERRSFAFSNRHTLLCFSHLRWNFVFQRPQHLMSRLAKAQRVVYWEEPEAALAGCEPALGVRTCAETGVIVVTPSLPEDLPEESRAPTIKALLDSFLAGEQGPFVRWYYTPMMLPFSRHVEAGCTVYDCMDELANFRFAPPELLPLEQELLDDADVVFTGGYSLYEAKRGRHHNIHPSPPASTGPFRQARGGVALPEDQAALGHPCLGFYGVIDERMDLDLLAALADAHPNGRSSMVGPVVKIDPAELPQRPNLHYLGGKTYAELPAYLAGWDVALMPFAINESTRFISPTKTPEYLCRRLPGRLDADRRRDPPLWRPRSGADRRRARGLRPGCEEALALAQGPGGWLADADAKLAHLSWDITAARMAGLIREELAPTQASPAIIARTKKHYDYLVVGAGFAGSVHRRAAGEPARRACARHRQEGTSPATPMTGSTRPAS
jgi:UDP-galactopyranose mutase